MSYKLNIMNPGRKIKMKIRRERQRNAIVTSPHKNNNKYILSGDQANVRQPQNIEWR